MIRTRKRKGSTAGLSSLKRKLKACKADVRRYVDMVHEARTRASRAEFELRRREG